ncbi:LOW QUALITY PROTEIN: hypothetical protein CRUP_029218, partial [Coryphaenoides rupestris]
MKIALVLLENGADPNATDKLDSTALHRASAKGNYRLIQLLLEQSASTNILDSEGNTALHLACEEERVEAAKLLVSHGASIYIENKEEKTPVQVAKGGLGTLLRRMLSIGTLGLACCLLPRCSSSSSSSSSAPPWDGKLPTSWPRIKKQLAKCLECSCQAVSPGSQLASMPPQQKHCTRSLFPMPAWARERGLTGLLEGHNRWNVRRRASSQLMWGTLGYVASSTTSPDRMRYALSSASSLSGRPWLNAPFEPAETADPVGGAREVEAGPRQPHHRHPLGQARVLERVQAPVDDGVVVVVVHLQVTVLCE